MLLGILYLLLPSLCNLCYVIKYFMFVCLLSVAISDQEARLFVFARIRRDGFIGCMAKGMIEQDAYKG